MKKAAVLGLCLIIAVCLGFGVYCDSLKELHGLEYRFTFVEGLNVFVLSPLLWICVGVLIGLLSNIGEHIPEVLRFSMRILSFALILVYVCVTVMYFLRINIEHMYIITAWCTLHVSVFVVPGLLCGISFHRQQA